MGYRAVQIFYSNTSRLFPSFSLFFLVSVWFTTIVILHAVLDNPQSKILAYNNFWPLLFSIPYHLPKEKGLYTRQALDQLRYKSPSRWSDMVIIYMYNNLTLLKIIFINFQQNNLLGIRTTV